MSKFQPTNILQCQLSADAKLFHFASCLLCFVWAESFRWLFVWSSTKSTITEHVYYCVKCLTAIPIPGTTPSPTPYPKKSPKCTLTQKHKTPSTTRRPQTPRQASKAKRQDHTNPQPQALNFQPHFPTTCSFFSTGQKRCLEITRRAKRMSTPV